MKKLAAILLAAVTLLTSCGISELSAVDYKQITPEQAKEIMNGGESFIILDVRPVLEYEKSHIRGGISIPDTEIEALAPKILLDKDATILVYGCNGTRSGAAARMLAEMGYTNVLDFGGIRVWPYGGMTNG